MGIGGLMDPYGRLHHVGVFRIPHLPLSRLHTLRFKPCDLGILGFLAYGVWFMAWDGHLTAWSLRFAETLDLHEPPPPPTFIPWISDRCI